MILNRITHYSLRRRGRGDRHPAGGGRARRQAGGGIYVKFLRSRIPYYRSGCHVIVKIIRIPLDRGYTHYLKWNN